MCSFFSWIPSNIGSQGNSLFNLLRISSFSKVAVCHFTFSPASSLWSVSFPTSSTMLVIVCIDSSYPYWCEMVSHWGFDFHFLGEVIYILYISVSPLQDFQKYLPFCEFFSLSWWCLLRHNISLVWLRWSSVYLLFVVSFAYGIISKKPLPIPTSWRFNPVFSFKSLIVFSSFI